MTDNSRAIAATLVGAALGGIAGYMLFTERGRTMRRRLEPALEDLVRELNSFGITVRKTVDAAGEGWKLLNDALGEGGERPPRYPSPHQTSPF